MNNSVSKEQPPLGIEKMSLKETLIEMERRFVINLAYLITGVDLNIIDLDKEAAIKILDDPSSSDRKRKTALRFADLWKKQTLKESVTIYQSQG